MGLSERRFAVVAGVLAEAGQPRVATSVDLGRSLQNAFPAPPAKLSLPVSPPRIVAGRNAKEWIA